MEIKYINVPFTEEEKERVEKAAKKTKRSIRGFCNFAVMEHVKKEKK